MKSFTKRIDGIITTPFDMFLESIMRGKQDRENKITELSTLALVNPYVKKQNLKEAKLLAKSLDFDEEVYPKNVLDDGLEKEFVKPPKTIFMPSRQICRLFIKAIA